jgi:hypothetical protein
MPRLPIARSRSRGEASVNYRAALVCIVLALGLPDLMRAAQPKAPAIDVSGTWSLIATHKGPPGMPDGVSFRATIALKQTGGRLDGHLAHQNGNSAAFTGVVIDKTVTFTAIVKSSEPPGITHILDFTGGTLDGEKTLKGHVKSVSTGPGTYMRGEGPYVATRR